MELTNELISKVKSCKSVEDVKALGEEIGNPVTLEEAEVYYKQYCGEQGEINLDELDNTSGGGCYNNDGYLKTTASYKCSKYLFSAARYNYTAGSCCQTCMYWEDNGLKVGYCTITKE